MFKKIQKENPYWSDYICFAVAVKNQAFSDDRIRRHFKEFAPKSDYPGLSADGMLAFFRDLTKRIRSVPHSGVNRAHKRF